MNAQPSSDPAVQAKVDYPAARMIEEAKQLGERTDKLQAFTDTDLFATLDLAEQELLLAQFSAMTAYAAILNVRLRRANVAGVTVG